MPATEIAEGLLHFFGRTFVRLVVELVFEVVCYGLGFVVLRLVTLGSYPRTSKEVLSDNLVSLVGVLVIVALSLWLWL